MDAQYSAAAAPAPQVAVQRAGTDNDFLIFNDARSWNGRRVARIPAVSSLTFRMTRRKAVGVDAAVRLHVCQ
jgi:hypothetical protein